MLLMTNVGFSEIVRRWDEGGTLSMRIDLVLYGRVTNRPLCVLDTKYKLRGTVANDDYNQVVAYAVNKQCGYSMLIYPKELQRTFRAERGGIKVQNLTFDVGGDLEAASKAFLLGFDEATGEDSS